MGSSPLQERLTSRNITLICRARNSSQVSSSTLHLVQSAPWSGKVTTLLLPEERCSVPGTIRGDFCIDVGRNIIHGSDAVESANKEIGLWFKNEELVNWQSHSNSWIYE